MKALRIPVAPVVVAVVVVAGLFAYYFYSGTTISAPEPTGKIEQGTTRPSEGVVQMTGLDVAKKAIGFAEGMRAEDGRLYSVVECDLDGACKKNEPDTVLPNTFLYLDYKMISKLPGGEGYAQLAEAEFENVLRICEEEGNCGVDGFMAVMDKYMETGDEQYRQILVGSKDRWVGFPEDHLYPLGVSAGMLAMVYEFDKDPDTLSKTKQKLDLTRNAAGSQTPESFGNLPFGDDGLESLDCRVMISELDVYTATKDEEALNRVKEFFDGRDIVEETRNAPNLQFLLDCSNVLIHLSEVTGDASYKSRAAGVFVNMLNGYWDTPTGQIVNGDYGFGREEGDTIFKHTLETLVAAEVGIKLHDVIIFESEDGYHYGE